MTSSRQRLAANVALGLAIRLLPLPHKLGDARFFVHGRLSLWPGRIELPEEEQQRIARFLGARPESLIDDRVLKTELVRVLDAACDFEAVDSLSSEQFWSLRFSLVAGADLHVRIDSWLKQLEQRTELRSKHVVAADAGAAVELMANGISYRIPAGHVPAAGNDIVQLTSQPPLGTVSVDVAALRRLAADIDRQGSSGVGYEELAIERFLLCLENAHGEARLSALAPGATQLLVAPTGSGKSVFSRLLALHLARQGIRVALVVPGVDTVWRETRRLTSDAHAAGLDVAVAPLSSWRKLARRMADYLERPPKGDPEGRWVLEHVGYACHLAAYADDQAPAPGDEPCIKLRQHVPGSRKDRPVRCPFAHACGRFRAFHAAAAADIIVLNHHALLTGRVPLPVAVDGREPCTLSTADLVLQRCGVILLDEIDAFQAHAIDGMSSGLPISSRGGVSLPLKLLHELERRRAERSLSPGTSVERARGALHRLTNVTENLVDGIERHEQEWPARDRMTWPEANDGWLAAQLFPQESEGVNKVRQLFEGKVVSQDSWSERLRQVLHPLARSGMGDGRTADESRAELMVILDQWQPPRTRSEERAQERRKTLADRLMHRAALMQLDDALRHLRPQLATLEEHEVKEAGEMREGLLGYAPWAPSPAGPLGRPLFGYSLIQRQNERSVLSTLVLAGDPHGLVAEIGGLCARARIGLPRITLGFSATARFRGAPSSDVQSPIWAGLPDRSRSLRVLGVNATERISGEVRQQERQQAVKRLVKELWSNLLDGYLQGLLRDQDAAPRARALVVTASHGEARIAAQGLREAIGSHGSTQVRYLVGTADDGNRDPDAIPVASVEEFGLVPAPAILVAQLDVIARGHNILQPGTDISAISGIFVLTRPVPPAHDPGRFLAHVSYGASMSRPAWKGDAHAALKKERKRAWRRLSALKQSPGTFRRMEPELRREIVCDVLVKLAQLVGRARRGGTPADLYFVDAAFDDEVAPWRELVSSVLEYWNAQGWLAEMTRLHGALVHALASYAGFSLPTTGGE